MSVRIRMKQMAGMGIVGRMRKMKELTQGGLLDPAGRLRKEKIGTGKRLTSQEKARLRKQREKEARRKKREARRKDN